MLSLVFCGRPWYTPRKASELGAAIVLFQARFHLLSFRNELFAFRTFVFYHARNRLGPFFRTRCRRSVVYSISNAPVIGNCFRVIRDPRYLCSIARSAAAADLCSPFVDDTSCRAPRVKTMLFCAASFLLLAERASFFHCRRTTVAASGRVISFRPNPPRAATETQL